LILFERSDTGHGESTVDGAGASVMSSPSQSSASACEVESLE
jgi:hypothetical protein